MPIFGIIIKNSQDNRIFGSNTHYIMVKIVGIRLPTPVTMIVVLLSPSTQMSTMLNTVLITDLVWNVHQIPNCLILFPMIESTLLFG